MQNCDCCCIPVNVMSQMKEPENAADEEPPSKKLRKRTTATPPAKRKQRARKCKKGSEMLPLNLCDLPTEILEKIIGNINIWHHNRIRGTCRRLKNVHDVFVMHEFEKASQQYISQDANSEASATLRVIKLATQVFVHAGFASVFCGCILPMLRSSYRNPFCPNFNQILKFLVHFYCMVTELMGETCSQRWRLLYTITLMQLIKAFDKKILSSNIKPLHWRAVVELKGPWMGVLWSSKGRTPNLQRNRCNLLVILAEMLIASITARGFKYLWECPCEMYVFGNDTSKSNRVPITLFTFTVYGSKKICNLFRSFLEEEGTERFQEAVKWPDNEFTINLDVFCKEGAKWGCSRSQHMELGPFSESVYDADEDSLNKFNFLNDQFNT